MVDTIEEVLDFAETHRDRQRRGRVQSRAGQPASRTRRRRPGAHQRGNEAESNMTASAGNRARRRVLIIVENLPSRSTGACGRRRPRCSERLRGVDHLPHRQGLRARYEEIDGIHIYRYPLPLEAEGALGYLVEYSLALFGTPSAWRGRCASRAASTSSTPAIRRTCSSSSAASSSCRSARASSSTTTTSTRSCTRPSSAGATSSTS